MISTLLFFGAFVPTVLVGVPLVLAFARPGRLRPHAARSRRETRTKIEVARAYSPLDLGPDPVHWPSERAWPASTVHMPDWPSAGWKDEHFGSGARKAREALQADRGFHVMAARRTAAGALPKKPVAVHPRVEQDPEASPASIPEVITAPIKTRRSAGIARGAPIDEDPPGPPGRVEIEALVAEVGLAGTVQRIIEQTGWDFRQAAQYLAKIRSSRR